METTLPAFTPIEESMFLTLRGRALDHRSPHPSSPTRCVGEDLTDPNWLDAIPTGRP